MIGTRFPGAFGCAALIAGALIVSQQRGFAEDAAAKAPQAAPAPAAPAPPVFSSDPKIAGAQHAVLAFAKATSLPALKSALTDRSAGLIGVITILPMAFLIESAPDQLPDPKVAPAIKRDFEAYLQRYGINAVKTGELNAIPAKVQGHGHEFLQGLVPFANRLNGKSPDDTGVETSLQIQAPLPESLDFFKFTTVSPTHVKVIPQNPKVLQLPGVETFEAVQEDGVWRVDLGDADKIFGDLKKSMKNASK